MHLSRADIANVLTISDVISLKVRKTNLKKLRKSGTQFSSTSVLNNLSQYRQMGMLFLKT